MEERKTLRTSQSPPHKKQKVGSVGEVEVEVGDIVEEASTFGVSLSLLVLEWRSLISINSRLRTLVSETIAKPKAYS